MLRAAIATGSSSSARARRPRADRRRGVRRLSARGRGRTRRRSSGETRALTFVARRPVEVRRPAAAEARLDRRRAVRPRSWPTRCERLELICDTYLSVVDARAAGRARAARARARRFATRSPRASRRNLRSLAARARRRRRRSRCSSPKAAGRSCCACRRSTPEEALVLRLLERGARARASRLLLRFRQTRRFSC